MTSRIFSKLSTPATNIRNGIKEQLKDVHTSMPGIIETFDPETQLATVQPAIKRIFITREVDKEILTPLDLPVLVNVPVIFPRGGGFSLTFPVKAGDECLLTFCERDIDIWHETGKTEAPRAMRFHDLSDATAFVGLSSMPNKIPNYNPNSTELKADDGSVSIRWNDDGTINITANNKTTVTAPNIDLIGNTKIEGTLDVSGQTTVPRIEVGGIEMLTHVHFVPSENANTQTPSG